MIKKLIFGILLFFIICSVLFFYYAIPTQVTKLKADLEIVEAKHIKFNVDTDAIHFGGVPPGGFAEKKITVTAQKRSKAYVYVNSDLTKWITITPEEFQLMPGESKEITITVYVPKNATKGTYEFEIAIAFFRILPWH